MIVIRQADGKRGSLHCDPVTKGIYVTTDPNDTTPLPAGAEVAKAIYTDATGKMIVAGEAGGLRGGGR